MSNFREMTPKLLQNDCPKNSKLLKCELIMYSPEARDREFSNMSLLSRFYEHFKKFRKICFCSYFREIKTIYINGICINIEEYSINKEDKRDFKTS